ncbi:DUF1801 domain-containing protein [Arenimonas composti]|uniref:YdhG-like domain-containing protein n=1 Tax=Arenimonas composti TR7-09 = DSM 18010 TaxID=1121013 RepID=A0A091BZK6_9GAMM|nr:DUF1801 domain-containing protein [Arenimonas composti]KFN49795.1 hypothetical protein P873_09575 [Arenimonas composti TR7-09 = DSM 18010]
MTKIPRPAKTPRPAKAPEHDDPASVDALIATLAHPLESTIQALRRAILAAVPGITEGVKWNSPSFHCNGWFATLNCRRPTQIDLVMHCGAKSRGENDLAGTIADPNRRLAWPSPDRAVLTVRGESEFRAMEAWFTTLVARWAAFQRHDATAKP